MEKITCIIFIVILSVVICFGQSHDITIPIKEVHNEMDNFFEPMDFHDYSLSIIPNNPIMFSFHNITDSMKVLVSIKFTVKNDYLDVKSVKLYYVEKQLEMSTKDSLKIANKTIKSLKKRTFYIEKHMENIGPDWPYFLQIPITLVPKW